MTQGRQTQRNKRSEYQPSAEETVAIVPVPQQLPPQPESIPKRMQAKTSALREELVQLRSNINQEMDQLQALLEKEGAAAEWAELLNIIIANMRESLLPGDIFQTVVGDAREALTADRVIVYQFDEKWQGTVVAESVASGWPESLGADIADPCFADRYVRPYQKGRVKAIENIYEAGLTDCHIGQLEPFAVQANLVAPILANEKLYGLLVAHQCAGPRNWTESEIEFFRQLAIQVGYALDQALVLEQQRQATQQALRLNQINSRLRQSLKLEDIFAAAVEETRDALQADRVVVYQFDAKWQGTIVAESVDRRWPASLGAKIADPCFADRYVQPYLRGRVQATENIYNANLTECHLKQLEPFAVKANLVAPIVTNAKLLGLLIAHQCDAPRLWQDLEIDSIRQVAIQVGYALDQAFLLQQQQTAFKQARLLNEITSRMREYGQTIDIFEAIVEDLREALQADRVVVYQFDEQWQGTVVAESVGRGWTASLGEKIADPCFADRYVKPYLRGRVSATENIYEAGLTECHIGQLEPFEVKANLVAPIIAEKKLYGLLIAHQCSGPRQWQESEIDFIKQLGTQVGFALDQVNLLQKQQAATAQARRLNEISSNLRASLNLEDITNKAVEETQSSLGADRVVVYQFDRNWQGTVVAEAVDTKWPASLGAKIDDPCFADRYVKPYLRGRVRAIENIYEADLTPCHIKQLEPFAVKANLVAPIVVSQQLHGLLIAHQCSGPRKWQSAEIDFISQVAIQVGYALDQAFLLQRQRQATDRSRQLNELSLRMRESQDLERIFQIVVEESLPLMQTDRIVIYRFDSDWNGKIVWEAVGPGWSKIVETESNQALRDDEVPCFPFDYVEKYRKGRVRAIADVSKAGLTECHEEQLGKWQVQANVVAPILVNQQLYGLLGAHQCSGPRQWEESEIDIFKQVALQLGYAIDQTLLLSQVEQARQAAENAYTEQRQRRELLQNQIEAFLEQIEGSFSGDLTVRARVTEGEMGTVADFFNATIENLQQLVQQVQSSATVAATTAQESEADVKELSQEALRQAEAIAGALSGIQTMANSINGVAANAQNAEAQVQETNATIQSGATAMNRTVESIVTIQQTMQGAAGKVKQLGEASKKISRVVNLISEVASQTNILALNASVEATRAGEDDQGFANVASEVRTLAEQSATATQEIEQIVEEIQGETSEVVKAMELGMKRVTAGTKLVEQTRKTILELASVSNKIRALISQIAHSATEQAQTSTELSDTMQEVAAIANQTSEQSVTVANSFAQLLLLAGELQASVAQFKVKTEN
ncbi:MAG: GAF domain-containing protein [Hormoscilla sp.]